MARAAVLALVVVLLAACGGSSNEAVRSGSTGVAGTANPSSSAAGSTSEPVVTSTTTEDPDASPSKSTTPSPGGGTIPTSTTVAAPDPGPVDPSPVGRLDPAELRQVVEAPLRDRTLTGAVAEQVALADGRTVWRVRIPGEFPPRAARLTVSVADREVGQGIANPDGSALVAVTFDGTGLVAGAPVTYGPPGVDPVAAGPLAVLR